MNMALLNLYSAEDSTKYFMATKIGKSVYNADRLRFYSDDKLLILDKNKSVLSLFTVNEKSFVIIDNINNPIDFDYSNGLLYLLYGESYAVKKYFLSYDSILTKSDKLNSGIKIDSAFNLDRRFKKPASISADKYNRYVVVSDTGTVNSINSENKMFSLKFTNYKPGDIVFDSRSRAVYSAEKSTKSLVKILTDGKLEQLITNFDSDNQFVLDGKGNLIIPDKKNDLVAIFKPNFQLDIILEKIGYPKSITINPDCDSIFYLANNKNEILRVDEIPALNLKLKNIFSIDPKDKIYKRDASFLVVNGKNRIYYDQSGKKRNADIENIYSDAKFCDSLNNFNKFCEQNKKAIKNNFSNCNFKYFKEFGNNNWLVLEKINKKDVISVISKTNNDYKKKEIIKGDFCSDPSPSNSECFSIIDKAGRLMEINLNGNKKIIAYGLYDFIKILFVDNSAYYIVSSKGLLLKVDGSGNKTLVLSNLTKEAEIINCKSDELIIKQGTKIFKTSK